MKKAIILKVRTWYEQEEEQYYDVNDIIAVQLSKKEFLELLGVKVFDEPIGSIEITIADETNLVSLRGK